MITKNPGSTLFGPNAACDPLDSIALVQLNANSSLQLGVPILRDLTQLPGNQNPKDNLPSQQFANANVADRGVLSTNTNGGDLIGVFQGESGKGLKSHANLLATVDNYGAEIRLKGLGKVYVGVAAGGTAVLVGSKLIVTTAFTYAVVGTPVIGIYIGRVVAYSINTSIPAVIAAGAQTVQPYNMNGIAVGLPLVIDSGAYQETVVPTAITATTFTAPFSKAHGANSGVQGIQNVVGASIIAVPGTGTATDILNVDINV